MTNELDIARDALEAALNDYTDIYLAIQNPDVVPGNNNPECPGATTSALLVKEYLRVVSLEKQIQQAKAAIVTSSNSSLTTMLMNKLPVEVLARIFQLVTKSEPCKLDPWGTEYERLPDYPIQLTHVCARWRQIIIGTPLFWSHIDVIPLLESRERLKDRVRTFITRAAHSSIDIHITSPYPTDEDWEGTGLKEFLAPLLPRMRSLNLDIQIDEDQEDYDPEPSARDFCTSILSICFGTGCTPGTLTQLNLEMESNYVFLQAIDNTQGGEYLALNVPAQQLEEVWRHVSVLQLRGIFPFWTSSAYHGLVELSLGTNSEWRGVCISENHLAGIMSSSPRLRVLELALPVIPSSTPCEAMPMISLEALILHLKTTKELESVMRLILPGQKPLRLTIPTTRSRDHPDEMFEITTETAKFFARSNLATLHLIGTINYFKILSLVGMIENVVFTIYTSEDVKALTSNKPPQLIPKRLYLLSGLCIDLEIGILLELIRVYAAKKFTLWGSYRVLSAGVQIENLTKVEGKLSISGTTAKVLLSEPPPTVEYPFASF